MNIVRLGERIRRVRKAHGMTQAEFAEELGVEPLHISNIERGKKGISITKLRLICKRFDMSMTDLIPVASNNEMDSKLQFIDEIVETLKSLELSEVRLIKTMICSLK